MKLKVKLPIPKVKAPAAVPPATTAHVSPAAPTPAPAAPPVAAAPLAPSAASAPSYAVGPSAAAAKISTGGAPRPKLKVKGLGATVKRPKVKKREVGGASAAPGGTDTAPGAGARLKVKKIIVKTGGAKLKLPKLPSMTSLAAGTGPAAVVAPVQPGLVKPVTAANVGSAGLAAAIAKMGKDTLRSPEVTPPQVKKRKLPKKVEKAYAALRAGTTMADAEAAAQVSGESPGDGSNPTVSPTFSPAANLIHTDGDTPTPEKGAKRARVKGTPGQKRSGRPVPAKPQKLLEVLDVIQRHDTYGVYAKPVSKAELPDYHRIIKNPMDFQTIRKKATKGKYPSWPKFRADIELLCNNASIYNGKESIYHKQAQEILQDAKTLISDCLAGGQMSTILANHNRKDAEKAQKELIRKEQIMGIHRDKSDKSLFSTPALSGGYQTRRADSGLTGTAIRPDSLTDRMGEAGSSYRALQTPASDSRLPSGARVTSSMSIDVRRPLTQEENKRSSYVKDAPKRQLGSLHARIFKSFVQAQATSLPNAHDKSIYYFMRGMGSVALQAAAEMDAKREAAA